MPLCFDRKRMEEIEKRLSRLEGEMSYFLVVYHSWFVHSERWDWEVIEKEDYALAKEYANSKVHEMNYGNTRWDALVIPLEDICP